MCGIAGAIGKQTPTDARLKATLASLRNRGPDAAGSWRGRLGEHHVTLLHTRLAIIDLDPRAHQPFLADGLILVFNGEIYNYLELRTELERCGYCFRTRSDTEVVVAAYRQYAEACVDRFEGMWAFALFDSAAGVLLLSRDRFGEKPLYTATVDGTLYFASEVKALATLSGWTPPVNHRQLRRYLVNGYRSIFKCPETYFEGVGELPAASNVVLEGPEWPQPRRYWQVDYAPRSMPMAEAVDGARARLLRALKICMRADVPLAFCLSGGVDSGTLASMAAKTFGAEVHAFSIVDSDDRYDESENIELVVRAIGCRHHVIQTRTEGFLDRMAELIDYHGSPIATISYYVHGFLSRAIARAGYKVALSGTGADELFTGYYDHYAFWLAEMHGRPDFEALLADWRAGYGRVVRNPILRDPMVFHQNPAERGHLYPNRDLFNDLMVEPCDDAFQEIAYGDNPLRRRMLNELMHEVIPVILREDDLNSMYYSLENRSPYLDRELAEFLFTVPNHHLIHNGLPKWLLRAAGEGTLVDSVRLDHRKRGFNASIDSLLDRDDPAVVERLLAPSPIFDFVRRDAMEVFLGRDMTDNSFAKFLFSFVSAKLFLESDLAAGRSVARAA